MKFTTYLKGIAILIGLGVALVFSQSFAMSLVNSGVKQVVGDQTIVTPDYLLWIYTLVGFALLILLGWTFLTLLKNYQWKVEGISSFLANPWLPVGLWVLILVFQFLVPIEANANQTAVVTFMQKQPLIGFLVACVGAPILEELLFRALLGKYLFPTIHGNGTYLLYCLLSALAFALVHGPVSWAHWVIYGGLGFALAWMYAAKQDIRYSMGLHAANNLLSFAMTMLA